MKHENERSHRIRVIAAICAMVVLAGSSAGVYAIHNHSNANAAPEEKVTISSDVSSDNDIDNPTKPCRF